jgi:calcineurin-like phosphoesterase
MCGLYESVLGFESESVMKKTLYGEMSHFNTPEEGRGLFCGVVINVNDETGLANSIFSIYYVEDKNEK